MPSNRDSQQKRVLKAMSPKALDNREKVQQLRHEYQVAGHLDHCNLLKVIEFSKYGPYAWIALEPFAGQSLRQMLSEKQRDALLEHLPHLAKQMCQALWHLHQHGWAHCSVKPANFLINPQFDLKLIDFSLASRSQHVPLAIAQLVEAMMAKDPEHRPENMLRLQQTFQRTFSESISLSLSGAPAWSGSAGSFEISQASSSASPTMPPVPADRKRYPKKGKARASRRERFKKASAQRPNCLQSL